MSEGADPRQDRQLAVSTPAGDALLSLARPARPRALALLGHGAGGGVDAPDLLAVRAALVAGGVAVARFVQPYRLAGRRTPDRAERLDDAWLAAVAAVRAERGLRRVPLAAGGRSSGARVACRTADAAGAAGVVALAFPLAPPGRPDRSRIGELLSAGRPTLVVQGDRDPFGGAADVAAAAGSGPEAAAGRLRIVEVAGADHTFRCRRVDGRTTAECLADVASAVAGFVRWLVEGSVS